MKPILFTIPAALAMLLPLDVAMAQAAPKVTPAVQIKMQPGDARVRTEFRNHWLACEILQAKSEFVYARIDLNDDGKDEIILQAAGRSCSPQGCQTVVLQSTGKEITVLSGQAIGQPLATSKEKFNGFRALLQLDKQGAIANDKGQPLAVTMEPMIRPRQRNWCER